MQGLQVQRLVVKLRSHMPHGPKDKKRIINVLITKQNKETQGNFWG